MQSKPSTEADAACAGDLAQRCEPSAGRAGFTGDIPNITSWVSLAAECAEQSQLCRQHRIKAGMYCYR